MTYAVRHPTESKTSAVELALNEPLSAGDVYQAKTDSVDFWAMGYSKGFGNRALLGLPSLIRRLERSKNAHEYIKTFLYAIPAIPYATAMAVGGGGGSMMVALALPQPTPGTERRSSDGVFEERLARALDEDMKTLTQIAIQSSKEELQKHLKREQRLLTDVRSHLKSHSKRVRYSGMLKSRIRAWDNQIEQLGLTAKQYKA